MRNRKSVRKQIQKRTALAGWLYLIVLLMAAVFFSCARGNKPTNVYVFAASSMNEVIGKVVDTTAYANVLINASSSGTLARQIEAGAPCDVYLSANRMWVDYLMDRSVVDSSNVEVLAQNSLVLVARSESFAKAGSIGWRQFLIKSESVAIGDPNHVPAGMYALQALQYYKIDSIVNDKIIESKDVVSALKLVEMGEADCGFVYKTDALSSKRVRIVAEMDGESHSPINYYKVCLSDNGNQFMADVNVKRRLEKVLIENGFN